MLGVEVGRSRLQETKITAAEIQGCGKSRLELGNSPEKLFKYYRELVTPAAARRRNGAKSCHQAGKFTSVQSYRILKA